MHPAPPSELSELIEAYSQTGQAVLDLGLTCRDDEFDLPTQCPGWTVKDQISHVIGVEGALNGAPAPDVTVGDKPWVNNEFGQFMETHVEARRAVPGPDVVQEWAQLFPERVAMYHQLLADPEQELNTPLGRLDPTSMLGTRVIDMWCHEQDIRHALNRIGNLDSPGAALFTLRVLEALPKRVAKAGLPIGTTVIIETTGPVQARTGVRVVEQDGKPFGEELFSGDSLPEGESDGATTTIRLTTEELTRRGAGRVAVDDLRFQVDGDEDTARQVLEALVITP